MFEGLTEAQSDILSAFAAAVDGTVWTIPLIHRQAKGPDHYTYSIGFGRMKHPIHVCFIGGTFLVVSYRSVRGLHIDAADPGSLDMFEKYVANARVVGDAVSSCS